MAHFLKFQYEVIQFDSRDTREMAAAAEAGFQVSLLTGAACAAEAGDSLQNGVAVHRFWPGYTTRFRPFRIFEIISKWCGQIRRLAPNVISCHDIYALFLGWLATWFWPGKKKPLLVYDSHEYQIGIAYLYSKPMAWVLRRLEHLLMRRATLSIMVNDSIADAVQRDHRLKARPLVVRSATWLWPLDDTVIAAQRQAYLSALGAPPDAFLLMYHGAIMPDRGLEQLVQAVAAAPGLYGVVLGNPVQGEHYDGYFDSVKALADKEGVSARILFLPAVKPDMLWQYVAAVDVGLVLIQDACPSYRFALPNKLFENIQSLTPVITSSFPEMERLVQQYDIGLCCAPNDMDAVNACIRRLRGDKALYTRLKQNLNAAKAELCWEKEKTILVNAYSDLLQEIETQ